MSEQRIVNPFILYTLKRKEEYQKNNQEITVQINRKIANEWKTMDQKDKNAFIK